MSNAIIRISRGTKLSWKLTITRMHVCVITAPGCRLWRLFMITEKHKLFLSFYVSSVDEQRHHEIFPKRHHQVFAAHPASFSESNSTGSCCDFSNARCQCLTDKAGTALFEVLCQSLLHHPPKQMQMGKRPLNEGKKRTFSCYSCLCSKIYRWSMHQSTQHAGLLWHQLRAAALAGSHHDC